MRIQGIPIIRMNGLYKSAISPCTSSRRNSVHGMTAVRNTIHPNAAANIINKRPRGGAASAGCRSPGKRTHVDRETAKKNATPAYAATQYGPNIQHTKSSRQTTALSKKFTIHLCPGHSSFGGNLECISQFRG